MNMLAQAIAAHHGPEVATYGWIIDVDHLERGEDGLGNPRPDDDQNPVGEEGISGPSNISDDLLARLKNGEGDTFKMFDDDGILYYTGRALSAGEEWDEDACYGPLGDFGMPNAGAVAIEWPDHSERDCA
jgi:hypothetical protein